MSSFFLNSNVTWIGNFKIAVVTTFHCAMARLYMSWFNLREYDCSFKMKSLQDK